MVIAHSSKAGQHGKQKASEITNRMFMIALIVGFIGVLFLGIISGLAFGKAISGTWGSLLALASISVTAVASYFSLRLVNRHWDQLTKERLKWLRGGQAEAWVSMLLRNQLGDRWHLFDNFMLDGSSDIDHILVGPSGIFVISTKSQRGLFNCGDDRSEPTFNGKPTDWPRDVVRQALRLKERLAVVDQGKQPWLQSVLALPFAYIESPTSNSGCPAVGSTWVLHEDSLIDQIAPDPLPQRLSKAQIARWVEAIDKLKSLGSAA
ncbi:MAG: nuclease-related domain-containing protein [Planctomycetota bacterium]